MDSVYTENETPFIHPFSCIIAGSSQSGKTVFTTKLIKHLDQMISPKISRVIVSYTEDQSAYQEMCSLDSRVNLIKGRDFDFIPGENTLIIIDDQMDTALGDKSIQNLFTKGVHHRSVSVILITQDLYPQEKCARTIRRNSTYLVVFRSPTFQLQVQCLGRQLYPHYKGYIQSAYTTATMKPYTYIFLNLHPTCHEDIRIRSGILPFEDLIVYVPAQHY